MNLRKAGRGGGMGWNFGFDTITGLLGNLTGDLYKKIGRISLLRNYMG